MDANLQRWQQAQHAEGEFWWGLTRHDGSIRRLMDSNREIAAQLEAWLPAQPESALEIGVGGLGVGALGFLKNIPTRVGIDPLPLPELLCSQELRELVTALRKPVQFRQTQGERIPFPDASFDLVLCCNVLDHVQDPAAVLSEAHRILRPKGYFYLVVDVFSVAGLAKWKFITQRKSKEEILVRAHPHRFRQHNLRALIRRAGLRIVREHPRSVITNFFGRSDRHPILTQKV